MPLELPADERAIEACSLESPTREIDRRPAEVDAGVPAPRMGEWRRVGSDSASGLEHLMLAPVREAHRLGYMGLERVSISLDLLEEALVPTCAPVTRNPWLVCGPELASSIDTGSMHCLL
jgi:hypothetical protein